MLNLSVLDYPDQADLVKRLTEHAPHPLDDIGCEEHNFFVKLARSSPSASDTLRLWKLGPNEK